MNGLFAATIGTDGTVTVHESDKITDVLALLQQEVQGLVDVVSLTQHLDMWLNDEGLINGMPMNVYATAVAAHHGKSHQEYFGPAVFTGGVDAQGETQALRAEQLDWLLRYTALKVA